MGSDGRVLDESGRRIAAHFSCRGVLGRILGAPLGNGAVVAGEEDVGNFHILENFGASILGVFEIVTVGKRFDRGAIFTAEDTGTQANDAVNYDHGGEFAAGQNVFADGNLVVD